MKIYKTYILIILVSIIISLYLFEAYLRYTKESNFSIFQINKSYRMKVYQNETGKNYDERTIFQLYKDLKKENNPLKLFPFELSGHYNKEDYKKTAEYIYKYTYN